MESFYHPGKVSCTNVKFAVCGVVVGMCVEMESGVFFLLLPALCQQFSATLGLHTSSSQFCPFFPGTGLEKMPLGNDCVITEINFVVE